MSGNRIGLKSAKGTSTSGFVSRSRVNRATNKQHRYLHESDMEDSDEEVASNKDNNKRQIDVQELINNKKLKTNIQNKHRILINKYYNKFLDFIEDNDIDLVDQKDYILKSYKQKLIAHYKEDEKELPLNHDLCNYKRQLTLLSSNLNINIGNKSRLEY
jgi:hypothetical protein